MSSGFVKQNNNFRVLYVFCTFLCRHCTTTTRKCLIWRCMEDLNKWPRIIFISPSKLESSPQKINSGEIHLHWHFQRIGINATMFEKMQCIFKMTFLLSVDAINTPYFAYSSSYLWKINYSSILFQMDYNKIMIGGNNFCCYLL